MFNKYIIEMPDNSDAIRQVAKSYDGLSKTIKETSDNEIESKNRVDITLTEYNEMKNRIKHLESANYQLEKMLKKIDFPIAILLDDDNIIDNVYTYYSENIDRSSRQYMIKFDVDRFKLKKYRC